MSQHAYEEHKRRAGERQREQSEAGRDIGPIPLVADPARRLRAAADFRTYCETYHLATFRLTWSTDHLKVIGQIQEAVTTGGLFATAMPRGSGKTSLAEKACEWATLNGYHDFVCLIGSDEEAAEGILESIKVELEVNDGLAADYPEVCLPIAKLEGIANRCKGQSHDGERTRIEWTAKEIVLPSVRPGGWADLADHRAFVRADGFSLGSGAIIRVAGITGGIRGMKRKRSDGLTIRPTLVVPDDPQTDASARSPSQCESRERILSGAVLGLAGPGSSIAGIMPCTVIRGGDMADRLLDRDIHPEWHGTRTKLVYRFPADEKLWEEYARIRKAAQKAELDVAAECNAFYTQHRAAMDLGSEVAWPERKRDDELSAIQHAMNLKIDRGDRAFAAEYQNEPLPEQEARSDDLTPDQVAAKLNRMARGELAVGVSRVTAFIDVQGTLLYWVACGWEDDFTGQVVDYGTWPDQGRPYFSLRDAKRTLAEATGAAGLEGQLFAGLEALTAELLAREWSRDDGAELKIERCLIDANWGTSTDTVYQFCRQSSFASILTPSHGKYIGAASAPMRERKPKPGDRVGLNWRVPRVQGRQVRHVTYDTNFWKSFSAARLATAMGDRGSLSLFGDDPDRHRLFAEHVCAEFRVRTEGRGRQVDEWKIRPNRPDNHWLDGLAGCAVAASMGGSVLPEAGGPTPSGPKPAKVSFAELQKRKRAASHAR